MKSLKPITSFDLIVSCLVLIVGVGIAVPHAAAWPSKWGNYFENPLKSVHTRITEYAIEHSPRNYTTGYEDALIEGANMELHELETSEAMRKMGFGYGVDVEAKRKEWGGTNEGCNHIEEIWNDAKGAYAESLKAAESRDFKKGEELKKKAYFLVGIMLHMIEDMGVPAHAKKLIHQGNMTDFDNLEFMALTNWEPQYDPFMDGVAQHDFKYDDPWRYYALSERWTLSDVRAFPPGYNSIHTFSKTWALATDAERDFFSKRQGRTCLITGWALNDAITQFAWMKGR